MTAPMRLDRRRRDLARAYRQVAYESLEGDGPHRRFQTPLATLHAFQGWADAFLATPNDGIEDFSVTLSFRPQWRRASFQRAQPRLGWLVKWADYDGPGGAAPADRTKAWLGFEFKL